MKKICKVMMTILALCMIITNVPVIKAEEENNKIKVGKEYYSGDVIHLEGEWIDTGAIVRNFWIDLTVRIDPNEPFKGIVHLEGGALSLYFGSESDYTGEEIVVGVRCNSGSGTETDPYTFELIYGVTVNVKVVNGIWEFGTERTYIVGASQNVETGVIQPKEGYFGVVVKMGETEYEYSARYGTISNWYGPWDHFYYSGTNEEGEVSEEYPRGWIQLLTTTGVLSSIDFVVTFQPIKYRVAFDKNDDDATGSMNTIDATYDKEVQLPACTMTNGDLFFDGWNTATDGSGDYYSDGAAVKNLTSERDGVVTLYAQWSDTEDYYFCSEGDGQTWNNGSTGSLSFTFDRSKEDRPVYENRKEVKVDGRTVDTSNYEEEEGSWIVNLNADYLNTLSNGRHTIEVVFNDNVSNRTTATFTVQGKETPVTPVPIPKTGID